MGVWVLEYRISHPRDAVAFDAVWAAHELGNALMRERMRPAPGFGCGSELRPADPSAPNAWVAGRWVGYFLLYGPGDRAETVARQICDRVREAALRAGWEWQGEAQLWVPSEDQLRTLSERFHNAEPRALVELHYLAYQPPWLRAAPE